LGAAWIAALITSLEIRERFGHTHGEPYANISVIAVAGAVLAMLWCGFAFFFYKTHSLEPLSPVAESRIKVSSADPDAFFSHLPRTSEDIAGQPMEPINIVLVGSQDEIFSALSKSGWLASDPIWRTARQHWADRGDEPLRKRVLLKGETKRRRLGIPMFMGKVT